MKFKIPANTELEDKILPFLTIRQLIILSIGASIGYGIFNILFGLGYLPIVWGSIDLVILGITLAAAFLKINHLEFHRWIMLLISKIFVPQKRFFNNGLIGGQNFDVLSFVGSGNKQKNDKEAKKIYDKNEEEKNNLDEMKNQIFGNSEKKSFDNSDLEIDEVDEFKKRFG